MKKVKYVGQLDGVIVMLQGAPVTVKNGDTIDVPDDFNNANFVDAVDSVKNVSKSSK